MNEHAGKRTILLAHRGELAARAMGPTQPIPPDKRREAHDFLLKPEIVGATFACMARQQIRAEAAVLE